jgi:predicted ATPase
MITLKKIAIEGYKSIAKAEVELRDLNVIVGANGSGKSNFLDVFKEVAKFNTPETNKVIIGIPDRILHHGRQITESLNLTLDFGSEEFHLVGIPEANELKLYSGLDMIKDGSTHWDGLLNDEKEVDFQKVFDKYKKNLFSKLKTYHFHDASEKSPAKRENDLHDNRYFRPDAANLAAYLYRLKVNHPHEFNRIQDCIRLVAPYFEHLILEPQEIKGGFIKLEWKQKGSDAYFDAYSLSDGTLRFICLATLLMQPEPPALILLDEPELGLHPFAITLLAEMLEDAAVKSQVILATQSVTLLNWMKLENIIVAEHDGQATSFKRLNEVALAPWLDEYSMGDLWEKNLIGGRP